MATTENTSFSAFLNRVYIRNSDHDEYDHDEYVGNIKEHLDEILEEKWEDVSPDYLIFLKNPYDGSSILSFFSREQFKPKYRKVLDRMIEIGSLDVSYIQTEEEQLQDHIVHVLDVVFTMTGGTPLDVKYSTVLEYHR
jgi:hypothetical protein